jgi:wyosine [tRNA(Phe)-imidazoG37] synthetase (radical SAM superfamily)
VDAPDTVTWKMINKPDSELNFTNYLKGLVYFSSDYKGILVTETMMVKGVNDDPQAINQIAGLISRVNPSVAYISIPIRPPALSNVVAPDEERINEAYQIFMENDLNTKLILGFEGTNTGYTGNAVEDIINISAVHPIREDTMLELLSKNKADTKVLDSLIQRHIIRKTEYKSKIFYIRQFHV